MSLIKVGLVMTGTPNNEHPSRQSHTLLLATDNKNSVLAAVARCKHHPIAYSAYGKQSAQQEIAARLGFNGELREAHIGWYLLGNGYRAYNPTLMRFHSPDSWSPFGRGGLNAYMYCVGDPVNASDPTGHMPLNPFKFFKRPTVSRTPSTSSLNPLISASSSPTLPRAGARPATSANMPTVPSRGTVSETPAMRSSESMTQLIDPSTGEDIYGPLPSGRRNWIPPSSSPPPRRMMTYEQMAEREGFTGMGSTSGSASQSPPGPSVDRTIKPKILNPASRPLPPTPEDIEIGISLESDGELHARMETHTKYLRGKT